VLILLLTQQNMKTICILYVYIVALDEGDIALLKTYVSVEISVTFSFIVFI